MCYIYIFLNFSLTDDSSCLNKDKELHPSHVIYIGTCTCNQVYIGETARNLEVRVNEHSDIN